MKLNRFFLEIDGETVQDIPFNDDLNIITNDRNSLSAGNSVGKSTLGRVLDYLFDGSINPVYIDDEFQTPNAEIKDLFTNRIVYATLEYLGVDNKYSVLKRRLSTESDLQSYSINCKEVSKKAYVSHIMQTVFNVFSEKPTIRKLAPKFFRTNQHRMLHTVKFDNGRSVSKSDINTVFLYLFNFNNTEILTNIHKLKIAIKRYDGQLSSFNSVISEQKTVSSIAKIKTEIEKLEKSLLSTDKDVDKLKLISDINDIDDEQNTLSDTILSLDLKIKNILKTNQILKNEDQRHLIDELRTVYEYAHVKIGAVIADFSSSLEFHNQLLSTKKEFVSNDLEALQKKQLNSTIKFEKLKPKKETLFAELKSKKKIEDVSEAVRNIGGLTKELIKLSAIVEQKDTIKTKFNDKTDLLTDLSSELESELNSVENFEKTFINNFKKYTEEFYGVEYNFSLNLDKAKGDCSPTVDDVESNNEGGLKRLEVITFDMSYIKSVGDTASARPNFVLHDSIDDIDIQYIKKMFNESIKLPGQHILSMLSDNIPDDQYRKYIVLELSQDDKFFTV
jgi:uncharacterized protein YydD (DUF2326 family)